MASETDNARACTEWRSNFAFITAVGIFTLLALLSGYNIMTALALAKMGQAQLIPAYMVSVSSFIVLVFTVLRSNGILFGSRDYMADLRVGAFAILFHVLGVCRFCASCTDVHCLFDRSPGYGCIF